MSVGFADGTRATIPVDRLQSSSLRGADWADLSFTTDEIVVPTPGGDIEISWFTLRALFDAEFAAYLDEFAAAEARTVGVRSESDTGES